LHRSGGAIIAWVQLLVLGGTVFLGRHAAEVAMRAGWAVTVFTRGLHGAVPDGAEHIVGDRTKDLIALRGRRWDRVIDTCGYEPATVEASASALSGSCDRYVFVSSASVYRHWPEHPVDESSDVFEEGEDYGPQKAACERAAEAAMPGRVTHVRAGVIVGPYDHVLRLPWWVRRVSLGGEVLAPGAPATAIQLIDARDLASWMLASPAGVFNATTPIGAATMGDMLAAARATTGSDARFTWLADEDLLAGGVEPWDELPLWAPESQWPGTWRIEAGRALAAGLACRPLVDTVSDVWDWLQDGGAEQLSDYRSDVRPTGLTSDRERDLLTRFSPGGQLPAGGGDVAAPR
jgi:nucleoside-diphosphate-sugar epimerase